MRLENYINDLLFQHHCVILPEFGGFLANSKGAYLNQEANQLLPPSKTVSFNQHLSNNDGLLVNHIAENINSDYDAALESVQLTVKDWKQKLEQGEKLLLENLGSFQHNEAKNIVFTPENKTNFLKTSFGLSTVSAAPIKREELKKKVEELEKTVPIKITPEKRKESIMRPWMKYAAVFMLLVSTSTAGYLGIKEFGQNQLLIEEKANVKVNNQLQRATFFDAEPIELPPIQLKVEKLIEGPIHYIIAGAFRSKNNADRKITSLKEEGFDATYVGTNSFGLHQVAYARFSSKNEATSQLAQIRATDSPSAWILTK